MTTEAKVGFFTVVAVCMLTVIVVHLGNFHFGGEKTYRLEVMFEQVQGLKTGAGVRYAGVDVGTVKMVVPDGNGARVMLEVQADVNIPVRSVFSVSSDGLMGEKFISIAPPENADGTFLAPGTVVMGTTARDMEYVMAKAGMTLDELQKLMQSVNALLGNTTVQQSLIQSAANLRDFTGNLNQLSAVLQRMAVNNEQDLRMMVRNLSAMSQSMAGAADGVEQMVHDFSGDGKTAADLRIAVANLTATSQRVEHMAANLEPVIADPQTAEELRSILKNTSSITRRADHMLGGIGEMKTEAGADLLYSGKDRDWKVNADVRLYQSPGQFLLLGVDDIGEANQKNLQLGRRNGSLTSRIGMVDSAVGIGIDTEPSRDWKFSLDASDPNDVNVKLRAQYRMNEDTYLIGEADKVNKKDERTTYFGLRRTF